MTTNITEEHELKRLLDSLQSLKDKTLLDLINGLEVTGEALRVRGSQSRLRRFWEKFNGVAATRQQTIDENLASGLRSIMAVTNHLELSQIQTQHTVSAVIDKLNSTRERLHTLTKKHLELRRNVEEVTARGDPQGT